MVALGRRSIALASAGLFLVGCGQAVANGPVVSVRPALVQGPGVGDNSAAFAAIEARMAAELDQASSVESNNPGGSPGSTPIDVTQSLSQVERIGALQQLGASQVDTEVGKLHAMVAAVNGDPNLTASQKSRVNGVIGISINALTALKTKIANDTNLDVARTDVANIANSHVEGIVLPVAHMLVAAYEQIQLRADYQGTEQGLKQSIANKQAAGVDVTAAVNAVADLDVQMATMQRSADYATSTLPGLSPADYPGNKEVLQAVHLSLLGGRVAATDAGNDIIEARTILGSAAGQSS
jgi:hypothetical protein